MKSKLFSSLLALAWLALSAHNAAAQLTNLADFDGTLDGSGPDAGLIANSTGTILYGTDYSGTVFAFDTAAPSGEGLTPLYSFTGGSDGASPSGNLTLDSTGTLLYGTTMTGGNSGYGTLFAIRTNGSTAAPLTPLYTFTGSSDGGYPNGGVVLSSDGKTLYGTASTGGQSGGGAIFAFNTADPAAGVRILYSFTGAGDGSYPSGGMVLSSDGTTLYGTTQYGGNKAGSQGSGTVFAVHTDGSTMAPLTPLYVFTGGSDGANPLAGVVLSSDGTTLYGTAQYGGNSNVRREGDGTVFAVHRNGSTAAPLTPLYTFTGGSDGAFPIGGVILGPTGTNLYGTAFYGGNNDGVFGDGTVFVVKTDGSTAAPLNPLYTFTNTTGGSHFNGANPSGGVVLANNVLYGTTYYGGTYGADVYGNQTGDGTLFKFSLPPEFTPWFANLTNQSNLAGAPITLSGTVIYSGAQTVYPNPGETVTVIIDGNPQTTTIDDSTGDFSITYDTSAIPGSATPYVVTYSYGGDQVLAPASDASTTLTLSTCPNTTTLYAFTGINSGFIPQNGVTLSGNILYGTTGAGGVGSATQGTLFSVHPDGTDFTTLHSFNGGANDGASPSGGLVFSSDGQTLYGTTSSGGRFNYGTIFSFNIKTLAYTILDTFSGYTDGGYPYGGVVLSSDGTTLYGTTLEGGQYPWYFYGYGVVFSLNLGTRDLTTLYTFTDGNDGGYPNGGVVLDPTGTILYGTAAVGGSSGYGTVFAVQTDGSTAAPLTPLYTFTGGSDGAYPEVGLVSDSTGTTLYGAANGGSSGNGTVFAVQTDGSTAAPLTPLYTFTGGSDGAYPDSGLVFEPTGTILYGTANGGGYGDNGTVFSIHTNGAGFTSLYAFESDCDGNSPEGRLALAGNTLYGTASGGGVAGDGTVFGLSVACGPPVAGPASLAATEGQSVSVPVTALLLGDSAPGGSPLSIAAVSSPTGGRASVTLADGVITYTPAGGFTGSDTIVYTLSDACGTVPGTIAVTVVPSGSPSAAVATAPGGQTATAAVPPAAGQGGVSATIHNVAGSQSVTVTAKLYASSPIPGTTGFGAGTTYLDLEVAGATASDSMTAYFYSPHVVPAPTLMYYNGSAWTNVYSDLPPPEIPIPSVQNGLWQYTVVFDYGSTPTITGLTGTVFALATAPPPALAVTHSGNSVIISWPNLGAYTLQQNTNLAVPAGWTTSDYPVTTNSLAGTNSITITPPTGNLFFRLASP